METGHPATWLGENCFTREFQDDSRPLSLYAHSPYPTPVTLWGHSVNKVNKQGETQLWAGAKPGQCWKSKPVFVFPHAIRGRMDSVLSGPSFPASTEKLIGLVLQQVTAQAQILQHQLQVWRT